MFHGLNNQFLYAAYKITATFADDIGNVKSGTGTCFFVKNKSDVLCLVTNRHVFDISYKRDDDSLTKYSLKKIEVSGKRGSVGDNLPESDLSFTIAPNVIFSENDNNDIACITKIVILSGQEIRIDYFIPYSFLGTEPDFQQRLVGINAGHLKTSDKSHSGISYFYKSTAILEIIDA